MMFDQPLLNSLQGNISKIDPLRIKKEETIDYRLNKLEEDVIAISNKLDLLINQLKIEFYKPEPYSPQ